ncbi:helix-turn-helix domain-containing protein [Thermoflexus sp.]|jgi:ATP-dependent DNA helicase RecG|uniref:AlbA family DNA-binding domain-containing protein n=1 Tax=Thermoflexus sp. TaxID=1969742 RepID=UPI003C00F4DF
MMRPRFFLPLAERERLLDRLLFICDARHFEDSEPLGMSWGWLTTQPEGKFLERKSCYDQTGRTPRPRPIKEVARDVAEALAAMANADGGTVVLGIEDDGTVSGVPDKYPETIWKQIQGLIRPQLNFRFVKIGLEGRRVWIFETDWSAEAHQLTDGRYLLRVGSQNLPFPAWDIEAMKRSRLERATYLAGQLDRP